MTTSRYAIVRDADQAVVNFVQWDGVERHEEVTTHKVDVLDDDGQPTGETETVETRRTVGWSPPTGHTARLATANDAIAVPVERQNENALEAGLDSALDNLRAYVNVAAPTAAQTNAVVKLLCRVAIRMIRLRRGAFDQPE